MLGCRFGRLVVVGDAEPAFTGKKTIVKSRRALCQCDCGNSIPVNVSSLRRGRTKSCGCVAREKARARLKTHGHSTVGSHSPTYQSWHSMMTRCHNKKNARYEDYGGRGIIVCDRWRKFENFLADMGERPSALSLDRIDNDRGYEPENCRWTTVRDQNNNTRRNRVILYQGREMTVAEAAQMVGLRYDAVRSRLNRGWSVEQALTLPFKGRRRAPQKRRPTQRKTGDLVQSAA